MLLKLFNKRFITAHKLVILLLFLLSANSLSFAVTKPITHVITNKPSTNQLLSFNFRNIQVRDMLQLLAKVAGINMVIDDSVQGSLALYLQQVTWQQALDTVLIMKNLAVRRENTIYFIAPLAQITTQNQQQLQQQALDTFSTTLHYADAEHIATLLRSADSGLLSIRGHVQADPHTNTLWVNDVPQNLARIRQFLASTDIPTKQVLIKARIISVDNGYINELGLQFGTSPKPNSSSRSNSQDGLTVDLPNHFSTGQFNVAVAKVGMNSLLDLQITALEHEGHAQVISSPELLTADRSPAYIEAGDEIPYQEKTSSGATNVAFKKAVLSLKVTPQTTLQNRIILNLEVNQDKLGALLINGVPSIQTRAVQTQVLIQDGQTLVLGGIYEQSDQQNSISVPVLGKIPLVGYLFKEKSLQRQRNQLLIFVTPKIMQQTTS